MTPSFPAHSSQQAGDYARYRPSYPVTLYDYLTLLAAGHNRMWDGRSVRGEKSLRHKLKLTL